MIKVTFSNFAQILLDLEIFSGRIKMDFVRSGWGSHRSDRGVSAGRPGDPLDGLQSVKAQLQVGVVTCGPEQVHGTLD